MKPTAIFLSIVFILFSNSYDAYSQEVDMSLLHGMQPRNIGPAGMSGRVTAIGVNLSDIDQIFIGTAAGGVWKSENSGHTWTPIFDDQKAASIGAVTIYQKNPSIIYVGSGEGNPRNSQNSGRGMYKSMDGGQTWTHLGLSETRQIHRVIIHPDNPSVVWAGVSGATWGDSEHRGVYKTVDGGATWKKVLYINDHTGVSDLVIDPSNPNKLIAGMWEHRRKPWTFKSGGIGSGMHVTYDGGETWKKLTTKEGMPDGMIGRIGLSFAPSNPSVVYSYIENTANGIWKSTDSGETWKRVSPKGARNIGGRPFYYADIYVDTKNENRIYSIATEVTSSDDGGKTWSVFAPGNKIHTDHHAWWSHPDDNEYLIVGHDGGLNISHDRGEKWTFADNLPLAQFYHIRVDNEFPYHVMGGLQDNGSWRGPSRTWFKGGIRNMYWQRLSVGDGFDVVPDPKEPTKGYAMGQAGNLVQYHTTSGQLKKIKPSHPEGKHLRFNWNTGIGISPIDKQTIYYGSQFLHRSKDKGKSWEIISPDLTTNDSTKTQYLETGGLTYDVTGAENHCSIISIDPSPLSENVIWVGTDDGNVQVTQDGGTTWNNVIKNIRGVPANTWVTQITASLHDQATAFVVFDDHRRNNWSPYIFQTTDYGQTWTRLADENDIDGYLYSFTQDPVTPNLMFLGSEFGLYVSFDKGTSWNKWTEGLPTMPISDLVIHPRDHDLVIGTFGRAIWILDDIRPLREMAQQTPKVVGDKSLHFFQPPNEHLMIIGESIGYRQGKIGDAMYDGENRKRGALLSYYLKEANDVKVEVIDEQGKVVRTQFTKGEKGVNRTTWNTNIDAPRYPTQEKPKGEYKPRGGFYASPGNYKIRMSTKTDTSAQDIIIDADPRLNISQREIKDKKTQIEDYNSQVSRVTNVADEIRKLESGMSLMKELMALNDVPEKDTSYTQIKEGVKELEAFKKQIYGEQKQGIYRDPYIMNSVIRGVGYALDHPLSPVTENQNVQLKLLKEKITKLESDWSKLESEIKQSMKKLKDELDLNVFK